MVYRLRPTLFLLAAALLLTGPAARSAPRPGDTSTLVVNITGLRNAKGKVDALLFVRPEGFPDDDSKAIDKDEVPIDPRTMTAQITFKAVPRKKSSIRKNVSCDRLAGDLVVRRSGGEECFAAASSRS